MERILMENQGQKQFQHDHFSINSYQSASLCLIDKCFLLEAVGVLNYSSSLLGSQGISKVYKWINRNWSQYVQCQDIYQGSRESHSLQISGSVLRGSVIFIERSH